MKYSITALVWATPGVAHRVRRNYNSHEMKVEVNASEAEPLQTDTVPASAGDAVDWHFMTDTFSWAGRRDQEEYDVIQGHACQGNGYYDQSYYASSLCYWHPETEHVAPQSWGLAWRGGYGPIEWCSNLGLQSGVCARCSVCHDNSRDRDASVDSTMGQLEIIPLPECMKEGAIETECNQDFEASNPDLMLQEAQCRDVQGRYDAAVANWQTIDTTIKNSEQGMTELIQQLGLGGPQGARCGEQTLENIRHEAVLQCYSYGVRDEHSSAEILGMRPDCSGDHATKNYIRLGYGAARCEEGKEITTPEECAQALTALNLPVGPEAVTPSGCRVREAGQAGVAPVCLQSVTTEPLCVRCSGIMDTLQIALAESQVAQAQIDAWPDLLAQKMEQITQLRMVLAQSYPILPQATQMKTAMEAEWLPQQQHCGQVYVSSRSARNAHVMACTPTYYDRSCEKACIEIQRAGEHGCGVFEGSQYGDEFQRGGVEVRCSPPAPSWVMSPSNYGGSPQVNSGEQCDRIVGSQPVRATTPVMMSGWLSRQCESCWFETWYKRFYVLESGNGVRSATLRSFEGALPDGTEETNDGIIMWDAEEVHAAESTDEQACFALKHRYRGRSTSWYRTGTTYNICVTRDDNPGANIAQLRDQWVSVLQGLLVWHPRVA